MSTAPAPVELNRWPVDRLASVLATKGDWMPYPRAGDRAFWDGLPSETRRGWIARGEEALVAEFPRLTARLWLDFVRIGSRGTFEVPHITRRVIMRDLAVAECMEGSGRFVDKLADAVWATCEESWWGWSAHLYWQKAGNGLPDVDDPTIDLGVGETVASLAWIDYLLGDALDTVSPMLRTRVASEARQRVLDPYLDSDDHWWLTASNNWNPWCTSNVLAAALALEPDDARRAAAMAKAMRSLDAFLASCPPDGGCDEGATYWTRAAGSLFDALDLVHKATGGAVSVFDVPLVRELAQYIRRVHIGGDWFVNFADGGPRFRLPGFALYRFGKALGDESLTAMGADAAMRSRTEDPLVGDAFIRFLPALSALDEVSELAQSGRARVRVEREVWLPHTEVFVARESEVPGTGLLVAAKGGHNDESHNHNDIGSFVVYLDGAPLLIDPGVIGYTAKTFGKDRYDIWTMQSAWHNLPTVNGVGQAAGASFRASAASASASGQSFEVELSGAYPAGAGIESWHRRVELADDGVSVEDAFALRHENSPVVLHLMTPCPVAVEGTTIRLGDDAVVEVTSSHAVAVSTVVRELVGEDAGLVPVWGERLTRVDIALAATPPTGTVSLRLSRA